MQLNKDEFELLRKIDNKNNLSQRELAKNLGFSLGKLNYCLKGLVNKGLVKLNNFKITKINLTMFIYLHQKAYLTQNFPNNKFYEFKV